MKFERTVTVISILMNHDKNGLQTEKYLTRIPEFTTLQCFLWFLSSWNPNTPPRGPVDLYLISENSIRKNQVGQTGFLV